MKSEPMNILMMGGTRFVGKPIVSRLLAQGHELTLFTRGRKKIPNGVEHICGDRSRDEDLAILKGRSFDVIIDSSGREKIDSQRVVNITGVPEHRFVYLSSSGVYAETNYWPIDENCRIDVNSRHYGKAQTEEWLRMEGIPFTSFRPTYIYGPGNYNPIERWFFDRILNNKPVPLPGDGNMITQLGYVDDLAEAIVRSIDVESASNRIYNCSGKKGITFKGLIRQAAVACGKNPDLVEMRSFDPSCLDPKARKAFPLRLNHFLIDVSRVERELSWQPNYDLADGLACSYVKDYFLNPPENLDFRTDQILIGT